jgi:glutamate formiminotransferase
MAAEKGAHRVTLPQIRAGEYEGISQKVRKNKYPVIQFCDKLFISVID